MSKHKTKDWIEELWKKYPDFRAEDSRNQYQSRNGISTSSIKKADESMRWTRDDPSGRERIAVEGKSPTSSTSALLRRNARQDQESLKGSEVSSMNLEKEIQSSIELINEKPQPEKQREALTAQANKDTLAIYERLFATKRTRCRCIENRTCSGCQSCSQLSMRISCAKAKYRLLRTLLAHSLLARKCCRRFRRRYEARRRRIANAGT